MHGDLRREVLSILDRMGTEKGVRWTEVARILNEQSSIPVEANELASVVKVSFTRPRPLTRSGLMSMFAGTRARRPGCCARIP